MYAQFALGVYNVKGEGVAIDINEAIKWFTRAASAGHANAQIMLDSLKK